jgi:excisionase family DNA binding protein
MEQFLTVKQLEAIHGVPASWWYSRVERNEVPFYRIGKYVRFKESEISNWLEGRRCGPRIEVAGAR